MNLLRTVESVELTEFIEWILKVPTEEIRKRRVKLFGESEERRMWLHFITAVEVIVWGLLQGKDNFKGVIQRRHLADKLISNFLREQFITNFVDLRELNKM